MKDFPLIFSCPMVRANHKGIKRMTRRVVDMDRLKVVTRHEVRSDLSAFIRPQLVAPKGAKLKGTLNPHGAVSCLIDGKELGLKPREFDFVCPYAQGQTVLIKEGDRSVWTILPHKSRVWVRETFSMRTKTHGDDTVFPKYKADAESEKIFSTYGGECVPVDYYDWQPSIHMSRAVCRDVYGVTKVRIERLQAITETDAIAEGAEVVDRDGDTLFYRNYFDEGYPHGILTARDSFMTLWHALHGFKGTHSWDANPWVWVVEYDNPLWGKA